MINTILLAIIAGSLLWGLVLREPITLAYRRWKQQRRVLVATVAAPRPPAEIPAMTLLLCDSKGAVEHEITIHTPDAPETYSYAGKKYQQERRKHSAEDEPNEIVWEYRR